MNQLSQHTKELLEDMVEYVIADLNPLLLDDDLADAFNDDELRQQAKEAIKQTLEEL